MFLSYVSGFIPKPLLLWEKVVYVSPSSITLHKGDWTEKTRISVRNRGEKPVHSVWVKMGVIGKGVTAESVVVKIRSASSDFEGQMGDIVLSGDIYRINAIDSSGREAVFIVIHTIPPGDHREFIVSGSIPAQSRATVKVVSFAAAPHSMLEGPNKLAVPFKPPEDLKVKSISFLLRKEHP